MVHSVKEDDLIKKEAEEMERLLQNNRSSLFWVLP